MSTLRLIAHLDDVVSELLAHRNVGAELLVAKLDGDVIDLGHGLDLQKVQEQDLRS